MSGKGFFKSLFKTNRKKTADRLDESVACDLPAFKENLDEIPIDDDAPIYSGISVLIIEDSLHLRAIMVSYLKQHGMLVESADNGQDGLTKYLDASKRYDLVFMDIEMPIMNGHEAARLIRQSGVAGAQTIPIVAISGSSPVIDANSEFTLLLNKPFDMNRLLIMIHMAMRRSS